jgi:two-component system OmpR family response regulator
MTMRILVVEDEQTMAESLRRGLVGEGFAVDVASDGEEGLWLATENPYDVIVLDIMLPKLNGYQVCRSLRAAEVWTPVLMLTAKDGDLDEAEGLDTGADDFVTKPFAFVVLVARIRALLRRGVVERPSELAAGDLQLDPSAHRVRRGETALDLTAREFSILEYLMRHAGATVSKSEIMDHVWDFAFEGDPNIVEVYVRSLRKKIDIPFERSTIETIRGAGYRLDPDGG